MTEQARPQLADAIASAPNGAANERAPEQAENGNGRLVPIRGRLARRRLESEDLRDRLASQRDKAAEERDELAAQRDSTRRKRYVGLFR